MTQQALGRHHHQRLAQSATIHATAHLAAQQGADEVIPQAILTDDYSNDDSGCSFTQKWPDCSYFNSAYLGSTGCALCLFPTPSTFHFSFENAGGTCCIGYYVNGKYMAKVTATSSGTVTINATTPKQSFGYHSCTGQQLYCNFKLEVP